jgi:hypothetical protein
MCDRCGKPTWHRRHMGIGTLIAVACTSGLWILVLPFYPRRCVVCGARLRIRHLQESHT